MLLLDMKYVHCKLMSLCPLKHCQLHVTATSLTDVADISEVSLSGACFNGITACCF